MFTTRDNWINWHPLRDWDPLLGRLAGLRNYKVGSSMSQYPVNVWSSDDGYVLTAEMPGLEAASINVEVENDKLAIKANKASEPPEGAKYHRRERGDGKVNLTYQLPFSIDKDKVVAKYQNGVLRLILPKSEACKVKKIQIES